MTPTNRLPKRRRDLPPAVGRCVVGDALRAVRVWSEEQWLAMPAHERPNPAHHFQGLGWVAAGPPGRPSGRRE